MMDAIRTSETTVLTRATRHKSQKTAFFMVTAVKTSNLTFAADDDDDDDDDDDVCNRT
jgi:hypothetical protein